METITDRINDLIKKSGLNQSQVARAIGVSPQSIRKWQSGESTEIKAGNLLKLATVLKTSIDYIQYGKPPHIENNEQRHNDSIELLENSEEAESNTLFKRLQNFWKKVSGEEQHTNAIESAKFLLEKAGYKVIPTPTSEKSGRMMVVNKSIWALPSMLVYLEEENASFYVDVYPEKRLWIINVMPDKNLKEILFVKQTEVIDIQALVEKHCQRWFGNHEKPTPQDKTKIEGKGNFDS